MLIASQKEITDDWMSALRPQRIVVQLTLSMKGSEMMQGTLGEGESSIQAASFFGAGCWPGAAPGSSAACCLKDNILMGLAQYIIMWKMHETSQKTKASARKLWI